MRPSRTILITCVQLQQTIDEHREALESAGLTLVLPPVTGQQLNEDEMISVVSGVDGIIAGDDQITRAVLERADRLRVIAKWGVGVDNIDLAAAAERGIRVSNTPRMFGDEVADVVIGYLVMLARHLHRIDTAVRDGTWFKPRGVSLAGKIIGIIGLGDIGLEVARRCLAMRMRVLGSDIREEQARAAQREGVEIADFDRIMRESDVVSLHCPLTAATHHLLDAAAIARLKQGAWVINTSRGALIDESALIEALATGHVSAAALDVFEDEPLPDSSALRTLEYVILGTHNSSNTSEAVHRTSRQAIDNLLAGLREAAP